MVDNADKRESDERRPGRVGSDAESTTESQFGDSSEISLDVIFNTLSNKRRRLAIEFLRRKDKSTDLSELSEHIAAVENDKPVAEVTTSERKRVYISLYQAHIPKMEDVGILDFEQDRNGIKLLPRASQLFPYLDIEPGQEASDQPSSTQEAPDQRSEEVRDMAERLRTFADRLEDLS